MELRTITPKLVKQWLTAWDTIQNIPSEALKLDILQSLRDDTERSHLLQEIISIETINQLQNCRNLFLPKDQNIPKNLRDALLTDMKMEDENAQSWALFYYRYFHPQPIDTKTIQELLGYMELRVVQHRIKRAISFIAIFIQKKERQAHIETRNNRFKVKTQFASHEQLIGRKTLSQELVNQLNDPDGKPILSIEGLGGIGKTELAYSLIRLIRDRNTIVWEDIIWVSARTEWLNEKGQLQTNEQVARSVEDIFKQLYQTFLGTTLETLSLEHMLKELAELFSQKRYLIVIDNLETIQDYRLLLPYLILMAGKTRFILTSRQEIRGFSGVTRVQVPELREEDSKQLLLTTIQNIEPQRVISKDELQQIYEVIGGIPLALKLIAGQIATLPVAEVLATLQTIDSSDREQRHNLLFNFIYRNIWLQISTTTQDVLLLMCDTSLGGTIYTNLKSRALNLMSIQEFQDAIHQLRYHSLLEIRGSEPMYSLHRLTYTFINNDVIGHANEYKP